jgi:hypothetical protein
MAVGSSVYFRQNVRVREFTTDSAGRSVEATRGIDAASTVRRLPNETLVVQPDGTTLHFTAGARIDRSDKARNYTVVIILPGNPIPAYLRGTKPDLEVR